VAVLAGSGAARLDPVRQKGGACGRRGACASVDARRVLGEKPQRLGRDTNATSRGGGRARRGRGVGMARLGPRQRAAARLGFVLWVRAHARGFWSSKAAAWPCRARSTGIPSPRHDAAARGDGVCGGMVAARRVLAQKKRRQGRKGKESPTAGYGWLIGIASSRGKRKGVTVVVLTGVAEEEGARGCGEARPAGRGCARSADTSVSSYGAGAVVLRGWRRRPPPRALLLLLLLSSHFSSCGGGGKA
jgi:hypothetical protein